MIEPQFPTRSFRCVLDSCVLCCDLLAAFETVFLLWQTRRPAEMLCLCPDLITASIANAKKQSRVPLFRVGWSFLCTPILLLCLSLFGRGRHMFNKGRLTLVYYCLCGSSTEVVRLVRDSKYLLLDLIVCLRNVTPGLLSRFGYVEAFKCVWSGRPLRCAGLSLLL